MNLQESGRREVERELEKKEEILELKGRLEKTERELEEVKAMLQNVKRVLGKMQEKFAEQERLAKQRGEEEVFHFLIDAE